MKETQLVRQILDYCEYNHLMFWRNQSGAITTDRGHFMKFGTVGSPDIIGCYIGRFVGIECKVGKNRPTDMQTSFGRKIVDNGGLYRVVYSAEEFVKFIQELKSVLSKQND